MNHFDNKAQIGNYAELCYTKGVIRQLKQKEATSKPIDEQDAVFQNMTSALVYSILFVNDQVYNESISLVEKLKAAGLYSFKLKQYCKKIEKTISTYNTMIFNIYGDKSEFFADAALTMEEKLRPTIDLLYYRFSQILLNFKVEGVVNHTASTACTMVSLTELSEYIIEFFNKEVNSKMILKNETVMDYLSLRPVIYNSNQVINLVVGDEIFKKLVGALSDDKQLQQTFEILIGKMLQPEMFATEFGLDKNN